MACLAVAGRNFILKRMALRWGVGAVRLAHRLAPHGVERIVRINPLRTPEGIADLSAICARNTPPPALMMTKARSPEDARVVAELLSAAGHDDTRLHVMLATQPEANRMRALAMS